MKFESKYEIGKEFFILNDNKKIEKLAIASIYIYADSENSRICYTMGEQYTGKSVEESELFKTKEALIESLSE